MATGNSFVVGLDLGQSQDFSALALLERSTRADGKGQVALRHLHRWALGTTYVSPPGCRPGVGEDLRTLLSNPPLAGQFVPVAVDQSGVGRAVLDAFRALQLPCLLIPVTITHGHQASQDEDGWKVPKKDLVGAVQVPLGQGRLVFASGLPLGATLAAELKTFKAKITVSGNETFEAWRERDHDDLVLALALACWCAERFPVWGKGSIGTGKPMFQAPAGVFGDVRRFPPGLFRS